MKQKVGWAEAIQQAFAQEADVVPEGWMTLEQVAEELKQNKFHVCKMLNRMVQLGRAETRKFRTWVKAGKRRGYVRLNRHYRMVSLKKRP